MRYKYSTLDPAQDEFDSLPRVPILLRMGERTVEVFGLLDSGSTVNVLPYQMGLQLGAVWDDSQASIRLSGNLSDRMAMPLIVVGEIEGLGSVKLAFAWVKSEAVPVILGQTNFFMEFDVHLYRSKFEFEITPKQSG